MSASSLPFNNLEVICTCAYILYLVPSLLDRNEMKMLGIFQKCARIDQSRLSL
uniref:Protein kish n=1 Tax=Urocitellus parryii TaxID=9999 RepID=A0A8D2GN63_UROPR